MNWSFEVHKRKKLRKAFIKFLDKTEIEPIDMKTMLAIFESGWDSHKNGKRNDKKNI